MKIISGKFKGRNLHGPNDNSIRPTSIRAKEMIFSTLDSMLFKDKKKLCDSLVLDCFCGTGALGIEAISRGAKKVIFVDKSQKAVDICRLNCSDLEIIKSSEIIKLDFFDYRIKQKITAIDIFFCDPPYQEFSVEKLLEQMKPIIKDHAFGILELPKHYKDIEFKDFYLLKTKFISSSKFCFLKKV